MTESFRRFRNSSIDDKLSYVILLGLSAFLFLAYLLSAFRSMVNADAGYYLGVTELIHNGYVPYKDFGLNYTPLFFYVLQLSRLFMGAYPSYTGYMLFLYLIAAIDAFLLSIIVYRIKHSIRFAWFSALVFLLLYFYLDGAYFILETFSLCCGLISMSLLVGRKTSFWNCFFSGVCCALAFLSKQYGLLFAGFVGAFLLFSNNGWKCRIANCFYALIGFCVILVLFVSLFALSGVSVNALVSALSGSTYGGQSWKMLVEGGVKACRLFPFLLFVPCVLFSWSSDNRCLAWACCTGLLLASLQFYFNVFPHYYIYMLPFVLVLNALLWKRFKTGNEANVRFLLFWGMLFTACVIPLQGAFKDTKTLIKHDSRAPQENAVKQLRQMVQEYGVESALCYNTVPYYALCPLTPSAMVKYGFSFGDDTEETYLERLKEADCFVVHQGELDDLGNMTKLVQELEDVFILLEDHFSDGIRVFIRQE